MKANAKRIVSLCDYTQIMLQPYKDAGYATEAYDLQTGTDVRKLKHLGPCHAVFAFPPCTEFAVSGARWWKDKGEEPLIKGLEVLSACMRLILAAKPAIWFIENPVGRINNYLGPPVYRFNPCDFGGWLAPLGDAYTKKTCLWGEFTTPTHRPVPPIEGSKMHLLPPSAERANLRSATPRGFARAFFEANP